MLVYRAPLDKHKTAKKLAAGAKKNSIVTRRRIYMWDFKGKTRRRREIFLVVLPRFWTAGGENFGNSGKAKTNSGKVLKLILENLKRILERF